MKILRLLNKNFYFILLYLFLGLNTLAEDQPADIWNIDKKSLESTTQSNDLNLEKEIQFQKKKMLAYIICNLKKKMIQLN